MNLMATLTALRERIQQRVDGRPPAIPDFVSVSTEDLARRNQVAEEWAKLVGTVNPRPAGPLNALVQWAKRVVARSLRWHGHSQRQHNAAVLEALGETVRLFSEINRNLVVVAQVASAAEQKAHAVADDLERLRALLGERAESLEGRITSNVTRLDAVIEDLRGHLTQKAESLEGRITSDVTRLDAVIEDLRGHLIKNVEQFWNSFADFRAHSVGEEMRLMRQRLHSLSVGAASVAPASAAAPASEPASGGATPSQGPFFDYAHFEQRFRGPEADIRSRQAPYVRYFAGRAPVLDLACGRGEFIELLREEGLEARGIDLDPDMVAGCLEKGLPVERSDALAALEAVADGSLGGVFSAQFIEHLPAAQYVRLIGLAFRKLRGGGALLLETQNPECLTIFSQSFYIDPTHVRPVPAEQVRYWMEEAGFSVLKTHYSSPVAPGLPVLPLHDEPANPALAHWNREAARFNRTYFGGRDYAVIGVKPS